MVHLQSIVLLALAACSSSSPVTLGDHSHALLGRAHGGHKHLHHHLRHEHIDIAKRQSGTYTVNAGDTGYAIAASLGIDFSVLDSANPGTNWTDLQIGQTLQIPSSSSNDKVASVATSSSVSTSTSTSASTTYTVQSGDTGYGIAANLGIDFSDLDNANPGVNWYNLQIGQVLQLPGGSSDTSSDSTSTAVLVVSTSSASASSAVLPVSSNVAAAPSWSHHHHHSGTTGAAAPSSSDVSSPNSLTSSALETSQPAQSITQQSISEASPSPSTFQTSASPSQSQSDSQSSAQSSVSAVNTLPSAASQTSSSPAATSTSSNSPTDSNTASVSNSNAMTSLSLDSGLTSANDKYVFYQGSGATSAGWPSQSSWLSFNTMWTANVNFLGQSCSFSAGSVTANTASENQAIHDSILSVASASLLDPRFILAIIIQESSGCVRVPTTQSPGAGSHSNPGLMQSFSGSGTCNSGSPVSPCPESQIIQMIEDGSQGTLGGSGAGLVQDLNADFGVNGGIVGAEAFYRAARIYNSGSVDSSGDLGAGGATHCYASDVANRLTGWVTAARTCTL